MTITLNNLPACIPAAIRRVSPNRSHFIRAALAEALEKAGEKPAAQALRALNKEGGK